MKIMIFAESSQYPNCLHILGLRQAIKELNLEGDIYDIAHEPVRERNRRQAIQDLRASRPDVILSCWPMPFVGGALRDEIVACRKGGTRVVWWWGDMHPHFDEWRDDGLVERVYHCAGDSPYWDFVAGRSGIKRERMCYLPEGSYRFDTLEGLEFPRMVPDMKNTVSFFGNITAEPYRRRAALLDFLKKERISVIHREAFNDDQNQAWKWQPAYWRQCHVVLSMSISNEVVGYTSARLFHLASCGACILAEWFPGLSELFKEGELLTFRTPEEAAKQVWWAFSHPEECQRMGQRAWERVKKEHTMTQRMAAILEDCGYPQPAQLVGAIRKPELRLGAAALKTIPASQWPMVNA